MSPPGILYLAGPTASGKSEIALVLARRLQAELVSVDSMQVYRGLDVGTAKPSIEERRGVAHHLVDVAEIETSFDAARFVELAQEAVDSIRRRGNTVLFCGGTGLYFKAWLEGLGEAPPADPEIRRSLQQATPDQLRAELQRADPEFYEQVDRLNRRRLERALEVIRLTGRPYSELRAKWGSGGFEQALRRRGGGRFFCLSRESPDLRDRIERRVDRMFEDGLVEETRGLLSRGLRGHRVALQALGYRQVTEHLEGVRPLDETIRLVKLKTWRFAKRQLTWFKRQTDAEWLHLEREASADEAADRIERRWRSGA